MTIRTPAALGATATLALAPGVYALLRLASAWAFPEPNPAEVLWSAHSGYVWRLATAAYASSLLGAAAAFAASRRPDAIARALPPAAIASALLLAAQAMLVP